MVGGGVRTVAPVYDDGVAFSDEDCWCNNNLYNRILLIIQFYTHIIITLDDS